MTSNPSTICSSCLLFSCCIICRANAKNLHKKNKIKNDRLLSTQLVPFLATRSAIQVTSDSAQAIFVMKLFFCFRLLVRLLFWQQVAAMIYLFLFTPLLFLPYSHTQSKQGVWLPCLNLFTLRAAKTGLTILIIFF